MADLSTSAIIVIVIVACLAAVSIAAALTRHLNPASGTEANFQPSEEQDLYMRSVRRRTMDHFRRESVHARDLESGYTSREASYYISSENMTTTPQFSTTQLSNPHHLSSSQFSMQYP